MFVGNITTMVKRFARHLLDSNHVSPHSFRKTHRTLLESRMSESYVKKLQGKSTDPYIHPEQTGDLTRAYVEHYPVISLDDNSEIRELRKEQQTRDEKVAALEARLEKVIKQLEEN